MKRQLIFAICATFCMAGHIMDSPEANPDCVLALTFNEGQGAKDWSREQHSTQVINATFSGTGGISGGGYAYNVYPDNRIIVSAGFNNAAVTILFWGKPSNVNNLQYVTDGNNKRSVILGFQNGNWNIFNGGYPTGTAADTQMAATAGVWQHVVYTSDGESDLRGYVNGVEIINVSANLNTSGMTSYWVGDEDSSGSSYVGSLDEVYIFERVMSNDEIKAMYQQAKGSQNP